MKILKGNQRGFTLIELLVAIPIIALIALAATGAIIQVLYASHNDDHMLALRQVQTSGDWVSRDGVQAQVIFDNDDDPITLHIDVDAPAILILSWTDWDDDDVHQITYSLLEDLKQLERCEIITDKDGTILNTTTTTVGRYIDATSCDWTSTERDAFTFSVTATVGQQTESRTYEVTPRVEPSVEPVPSA